MTEKPVEDRDGTIALIQGQVIVVPPQGMGNFPTIAPGQGVDIWVEGEKIEEPTVVTAAAQVKIEARSRPGKRQIRVKISPDRLQAAVQVQYDPGVRYSLPNISHTNRAVVEGVEEKGLPPITADDIRAELAAHKVCVGIDEEALRRAAAEASGEPVVVARGRPPGESKDAWIEYLFSQEERIIRPAGEERVDYRERVEIPTVPPGTLIAIKHPPQMGTPGMGVTGETLKPRIPKDVEIKAGKGVEVDPTGQKAFATVGGRPMVTGGGKLEILSTLVQRGDVDLSTGNINFHGDVEVYGRVTENMKVKSGGNITVYRNVTHATLEAGGSIIIKANLIGGYVRAGGMAALYRQIQPILRDLLAGLRGLDAAMAQLEQLPQFKAQVEAYGTGPVLQLLVEQKFADLPSLTAGLAQCMETDKDVDEEDRRLALSLKEAFHGINVQRLTKEQMKRYIWEVARLLERTEKAEGQRADIEIYYAQNARIEATGLVAIRGQGSYHSHIMAGEGVLVTGHPGVVRGGSIQSFGDVYINEVGSPGGTPTVISCSAEAKMELGRVYPNVIVQVGSLRHKFEREAIKVRARLLKGELLLD